MSEKSSFVITVGDHEPIPSLPEKTILESLEACQVAVHYHCREGFCGACRSKLLCGSVDYTTDPLAYIDDDEILPCCTVPTSDIQLKIES